MARIADSIFHSLNKMYSWECHMPKVTLLKSKEIRISVLTLLSDTGGQNRFRIPQRLDTAWEGARHAWNYSNACPDNDPEDDGIYGMSEDCLSINVVRPSGMSSDTKYPVMLWIHGGR